MKLSKRAQSFPADYIFSIKPTEPQLDYFIGKAGLHNNRFDYWQLINLADLKETDFNLTLTKFKRAVLKAFSLAKYEFEKMLDRLNLKPEVIWNAPPNLLFHVEIPSQEILNKLSNAPGVRSVQPGKITDLDIDNLPEDMPNVPPEIEEELENWHPHRSSFKLSIHASNYIEKKKEESGNITYIYSDKHVKQRNKKKVKRILQLGKSIKKLRTTIKKDLKNETLKPVALAVALIDETYERIGNPSSAKDNHFGVTTWRKKHLTFSKNQAKIKYKGKAGVDQEKFIKNPAILKDLKELVKDKKDNDEIFSNVSAKQVNKYLKPFKITAKDIRGFHANEEMKKALKSAKSEEKDTEKRRKERFKKALEETAKLVGHNPSTLKNQYLAPSLEEEFLTTGKITIKASFKLAQDVDLRTLFPPVTFGGFTDLNWTITKYDPDRIEATISTRYRKLYLKLYTTRFSTYLEIITPGNQFLDPETDRMAIPTSQINQRSQEFVDKINKTTLKFSENQEEYLEGLPQEAFSGWTIDPNDDDDSVSTAAHIYSFGTNLPRHFNATLFIHNPDTIFPYKYEMRWNKYFAPEINDLATEKDWKRSDPSIPWQIYDCRYLGDNPEIVTQIMKTLGQKAQKHILAKFKLSKRAGLPQPPPEMLKQAWAWLLPKHALSTVQELERIQKFQKFTKEEAIETMKTADPLGSKGVSLYEWSDNFFITQTNYLGINDKINSFEVYINNKTLATTKTKEEALDIANRYVDKYIKRLNKEEPTEKDYQKQNEVLQEAQKIAAPGSFTTNIPFDFNNWSYATPEFLNKMKEYPVTSLRVKLADIYDKNVGGEYHASNTAIYINTTKPPNTKEEYQTQKEELYNTLHHEMLHFFQDIYAKIMELPQLVGLPRSTRSPSPYTPYGAHKRNPSKKENYPLRDIEYYPILQDIITYIKSELPQIPEDQKKNFLYSIIAAQNNYISTDSIFYQYHAFFSHLKSRQPKRWQRAVKELFKSL